VLVVRQDVDDAALAMEPLTQERQLFLPGLEPVGLVTASKYPRVIASTLSLSCLSVVGLA
jgi:hypothetical protein